jgi:hypothetical protein
MKRIWLTALAAVVLTTSVPAANAAVCAAGVYRAGCVGAHGAVVVRKLVYHRHCYYRAGVRICR